MTPGSSRRGNLMDMFTVIAMIGLALGVGLIFITIVNGLNDEIQSSDIPSEGKLFMSTIQSQNGWALDFIFIMLLIALPLGSAILAYLNNIPPWLYIVSTGLWLLVILIANVVGDAYLALAAEPGLATTIQEVPMTNYVMSNFMVYAFVCLVIIAFGVYAKSRRVLLGGY